MSAAKRASSGGCNGSDEAVLAGPVPMEKSCVVLIFSTYKRAFLERCRYTNVRHTMDRGDLFRWECVGGFEELDLVQGTCGNDSCAAAAPLAGGSIDGVAAETMTIRACFVA